MPEQTPYGNVALITGAGSGIGRELALLLADQGVRIAAVDIAPSGLAVLQSTLQARNRPIAVAIADVTQAAHLREQVAGLEAQLGPIDLLIASAGVGLETRAQPFEIETITAVININLLGVANSIAAVLPGMIERRRGHVVGMSSLASYRGLPGMFAYCASKAGLNSLLEGLRIELQEHNVHVTTVCPGWIRTPMTAKVTVPMPGILEVNYAARRILDAIRRRRTFFAFPAATARQTWLLRFLPASLSDWLVHRMATGLDNQSRPPSG